MDIVFQGTHTSKEAANRLKDVLAMLQKQYNIQKIRELSLTITLMDADGNEVELVDTNTNEVLRVFEILPEKEAFLTRKTNTVLKLIIDNT